MLAATYTQGDAFRVSDVPEPRAGTGDILLRVAAATICGTDMKIVRQGHRKLAEGQRIVLGHEFTGRIAEVGTGVEGFAAGERVGVAPNAGCGHCRACIRGRANYCSAYTAFGIDRDGAHAPLVRIPEIFIRQGNVVKLPEDLSDAAASLLEPFSCAVGGNRSVDVHLGDTVLIYGMGPIGLMHLLLAKASGAAKILVADPQASRLGKALELGATRAVESGKDSVAAAVKELTAGEGVDVAITACPVPSVQEEALGLLATFGRLCLFGGLPKGKNVIAFDSNLVHYKNLHVTGTTGGSNEDYRLALELASTSRVDLAKLVSHTFPLGEMARAYETALNAPAGKVMLVAE